MRVVGATLGEWGRDKYGLKPVKQDALEYWPVYLDHLRDLVKEEQAKALERGTPCAFVPFRCRPNLALLCTQRLARFRVRHHVVQAMGGPQPLNNHDERNSALRCDKDHCIELAAGL